ncbi:unnamed protein product [Sphagnum jensenii]|uniref:Uncharacterized protein n=1 Tax=Sphagnum jensenii TaxID=128206 RepID=A0ABP0VZL8_9BRYO
MIVIVLSTLFRIEVWNGVRVLGFGAARVGGRISSSRQLGRPHNPQAHQGEGGPSTCSRPWYHLCKQEGEGEVRGREKMNSAWVQHWRGGGGAAQGWLGKRAGHGSAKWHLRGKKNSTPRFCSTSIQPLLIMENQYCQPRSRRSLC